MILVSIHDVKADTYSPLVVSQNEDTAKRQFAMLINDNQKTLMSTHPQDFNLICVGHWSTDLDRNTGKVKPSLVPAKEIVCLGNGVDFKAPSKE